MDSQKPKSFESTAFEILNHENLQCYCCDFQIAGLEHTKELLSKHIDMLFTVEDNKKLVFMANKDIINTSISFVFHGQKVDLIIEKLNWSVEKRMNLFMNYAIDQNESILKVKDGLYFMPFESFYTITRKDKKNKIYPFFNFEIIALEDRVIVAFKFVLYSQIYENLETAMKEEQVSKSENLAHIIIPLFNYESNFLTFEGLGNKDELSKSDYFEQLKVNLSENNVIVKLSHFDNKSVVTVPAKDFNMLTKLEYSSFIKEKI